MSEKMPSRRSVLKGGLKALGAAAVGSYAYAKREKIRSELAGADSIFESDPELREVSKHLKDVYSITLS